ncbi:MAG: phenylalanine--tRNA ligase subunit beta, partial [Desulfomonilaceae bacterium]
MLISFNWLKEFVDIDHDVEEVSQILTMGGIEVENIAEVGRGLGDVITARIEHVSVHPHAPKLTLVTLDTGGEKRTVVCGAPNVREGQIVAYCPAGGALPSGLRLEERVIKGVPSPGMICSEKELELGDDESGILELEPDTRIGAALPKALPYVEDFVMEVSITPNRGDCLSVLGVARELAALTDKKWRMPSFTMEESAPTAADMVRVEVPDADLCPRYVVRVVQGTTIAPSPLDVRLKLSRSGVRPISNVVDVTNLVLLESGQPLHAFDHAMLKQGRIVVRRADPGERFVTLDGVERIMPPDALMIRDGERSVALAGIMGGLNSEISPSTTCVAIESACFERFGIRRTAKALGMMTEASYRFERGVDPEGSLWAAHRAAYLIQKLAGGRVLQGVVDVYPQP